MVRLSVTTAWKSPRSQWGAFPGLEKKREERGRERAYFYPRSLVSLCLITKSLTGVALIEGLFDIGIMNPGLTPGAWSFYILLWAPNLS